MMLRRSWRSELSVQEEGIVALFGFVCGRGWGCGFGDVVLVGLPVWKGGEVSGEIGSGEEVG